jgi:MFS family permease
MLRPPNRAILILFICTAFASTGMFTAITLGAISAVEVGAGRATSGLPAALAILGTAIGAITLGALMARRTWRLGLRTGWLFGAGGGVIAAFGVQQDSFVLVLVGMFAIGFGNAGSQLARFAAARTVSPAARGTAVAWVVWAAAIGAVLGPLTLGVWGDIAHGAGYERGVGGYVLVVLMQLAAAFIVSLFRPVEYVPTAEEQRTATARSAARTIRLAPAVGSLVAAQACMVMVMAITPVHLHDGGHGYGVVGTVMSSHFVGMFALAPLVGWVVDRVAPTQAIRLGHVVLAVGALLAASMPLERGALLSVPLLLVGLGWCACFVSASASVAGAVTGPRMQGRIDSLVWLGSATSSTLAGVMLAAWNYETVSLVAMAIVLLVTIFVAGRVADVTPRPEAPQPASP